MPQPQPQSPSSISAASQSQKLKLLKLAMLFGYAGRVQVVFPEDVIGLVKEKSDKVPT